jgi:beta-1,4-mannosyltransferase
VLVTGKGPLEAVYREKFAAGSRRRIRLATGWVERPDYAALVQCADLGLCLHRSASGLDLPIKLADMRGAKLPCCAFDYGPCLREVMTGDGHTHWYFNDADALARLLDGVLAGSPGTTPLDRARRGLAARQDEPDWETEWARVAAPLLLDPMKARTS